MKKENAILIQTYMEISLVKPVRVKYKPKMAQFLKFKFLIAFK